MAVPQAPDCSSVLQHVRRLHAASAAPLDDVERVLTDGYACVLRTEGERRRLRGRLEQQAATLGDSPSKEQIVELTVLAQGIARADREVEDLRAALDGLAARARSLR